MAVSQKSSNLFLKKIFFEEKSLILIHTTHSHKHGIPLDTLYTRPLFVTGVGFCL